MPEHHRSISRIAYEEAKAIDIYDCWSARLSEPVCEPTTPIRLPWPIGIGYLNMPVVDALLPSPRETALAYACATSYACLSKLQVLLPSHLVLAVEMNS